MISLHTLIAKDQLNTIDSKFIIGGINMGYSYGGGFALIVVLFILLIIVGAAWF